MFFALRGLAKGICQERACRILPQKVRVTDDELRAERLRNSCLHLFLGVKSSVTCPSWRISRWHVRFRRYDEAAETYKKGLELAPQDTQKGIEKGPRSRSAFQNFRFWLRQDSSLKEGLQKANSVLVLEEPLGHRMPMSKYFFVYVVCIFFQQPNLKLRILLF